MTYFKVFLFLFLLTISTIGRSAEEVVLSPGGRIELTLQQGETVWADTGKFINIRDQAKQVQVSAKALGLTHVRVGKKDFVIKVVPENTAATYQKLKKTIAPLQGLNCELNEQKIQVGGELLRVRDWQTIASNMLAGDEYQFMARVPEHLASEVSAHFKALLARNELPPIPIDIQTTVNALIPRDHEDLRSQYARVLAPYGISLAPAPALLSVEPMVRVKINVTEIKRTSMMQLGLAWPTSYSARIFPAPRADDINPLEVQLQALEQNGTAKILAMPTLLCRSGKEAEFLAGGEFPIKIANFTTHDVIWKRYGVLLKIKPVADYSGKMSIAIKTEVSTIDEAHTVEGVPGILTNRIESHFDLSESRTIALSGLIKKEEGKSDQGIPGLQSLPLLGRLFSTRYSREDATELVIFVTPAIELAEKVRDGNTL